MILPLKTEKLRLGVTRTGIAEANHPPKAVLIGDSSREILELKAKPGERLELSAARSGDPDGDGLRFEWWEYGEAGSLREPVEIAGRGSEKIAFTAPELGDSQAMHLILRVEDNGTPKLAAYRRAVIMIER